MLCSLADQRLLFEITSSGSDEGDDMQATDATLL